MRLAILLCMTNQAQTRVMAALKPRSEWNRANAAAEQGVFRVAQWGSVTACVAFLAYAVIAVIAVGVK